MSDNSKIKVILMGGNLIACKILRHLFRMRNVSITLVVALWDDNGSVVDQNVWNSSLVRTALSKGLKVIQPTSLNSSEFLQEILKSDRPDLIITAEYNHYLNKKLLDFPKIGVVNVHFSKLPRHRGYFPYLWSILEDDEAGVTLHWVTDKINGGDIIAQKSISIGYFDTSFSLYLRLTKIAIKLFAKYFPKIINGKFTQTPQRVEEATYHPLGYPNQGLIDWSEPAEKIRKLVYALTFPGLTSPIAYLLYNSIPIEILTPVAVIPKNSEKYPEPGSITDMWGIFWEEPEYPEDIQNALTFEMTKDFGATIQTGDGQLFFNYFRIKSTDYRMKAHKMATMFGEKVGNQLTVFKELNSEKNMSLIVSDYFP